MIRVSFIPRRTVSNYRHIVTKIGVLAQIAKSLTGYCVLMGSYLISWKTQKKQKQKTVAKSSDEAKYRSMSATTLELEGIYL